MANRTKSPLEPEVYHALIELKAQGEDIDKIAEELKDFRIESHGRITKLETKAGVLGFIGGAVSGGLIKYLLDFLTQ